MNWFEASLASLPPLDDPARAAVTARAAEVLRPAGALRRLDEVVARMAAVQGTTSPKVTAPTVVVFAADHGVASSGVSAYPVDVTAAMLAAVRAGKATINAMAGAIGAAVDVYDVGVGEPTGDIRVETAMSPDRFATTISTAVGAVDAAADRGADLIVLGELGIGNTTVAEALAATLLGGDAALWVGRGTGVDDDGLGRKRAAVEAARSRVGGIVDPIEIMREVGGAELTAMAAACLRARQLQIPVILDGYLAGAAVLPLHCVDTEALDHCIAGHASAEPGHRRLLDEFGLEPLLDLELRLGEGSGALAAVPLVAMACSAVVDVPTFAEWFGAAEEEHAG
jgi:nicotinate-nucleotide--dimethylbenzimidazole phosphoribosyltransferase